MVDDFEFRSKAHHHLLKLKDGTKLTFTPEWKEVKRGKQTVRQRDGSSYLAETKEVFDELWAGGYRGPPAKPGGKKPRWTGDTSAPASSDSEAKQD